MTNPAVVDLSHWNPTPNWKTLRANGTFGCIHKATQGVSMVDDQLFSRAQGAIAAGLGWSTYHYLERGNIDKQMKHYFNTVDPRPGERMVIDHEADASLDELKKAVKLLLGTPRNLQVTVYSGHTIKDQLGDTCDEYLRDNTSLWIAHYASQPTWPKATWPAWSLWQYTDKASVAGISQPVDGDNWNGSVENLIKWFGPAAPAPEPEPEPEPEEVSVVSITGKVTIIYNGEQIA